MRAAELVGRGDPEGLPGVAGRPAQPAVGVHEDVPRDPAPRGGRRGRGGHGRRGDAARPAGHVGSCPARQDHHQQQDVSQAHVLGGYS